MIKRCCIHVVLEADQEPKISEDKSPIYVGTSLAQVHLDSVKSDRFTKWIDVYNNPLSPKGMLSDQSGYLIRLSPKYTARIAGLEAAERIVKLIHLNGKAYEQEDAIVKAMKLLQQKILELCAIHKDKIRCYVSLDDK